MIRFIDLTNQIMIPADDEIYREFAFYNTVNDKFVDLCGSQTWHTIKDFLDDFAQDKHNNHQDEPMRFLGLIPKEFYDSKWDEYGQ